jgi:hypothetical protein
MERDEIALAQKFLQNGAFGSKRSHDLSRDEGVINQDPHLEGFCPFRYCSPDMTESDDAEGFALHFRALLCPTQTVFAFEQRFMPK